MSKKKNKKKKPNYVARASVWRSINLLLLLLIAAGIGAFAYLQFVFIPTAEAELAGIMSIVSVVALGIGAIALFWQLVRIILALCHRFEFYDDRVVEKRGLLSTDETQGVFIGIYTVNVRQNFWGKIFNYGDVVVDYPGYWDLQTVGLAAPHRLKRYLETKMTKRSLNAIIAS